jgi:hypothetical protein
MTGNEGRERFVDERRIRQFRADPTCVGEQPLVGAAGIMGARFGLSLNGRVFRPCW